MEQGQGAFLEPGQATGQVLLERPGHPDRLPRPLRKAEALEELEELEC